MKGWDMPAPAPGASTAVAVAAAAGAHNASTSPFGPSNENGVLRSAMGSRLRHSCGHDSDYPGARPRCQNLLVAGTLYLGTSGFAYDEWKGPFYPEKLKQREMLPFYAGRFN